MLKLFGAVLALAACAGIGFTLARNYTERPRQLRAIESALQMLETEIVYGATPLTEALDHIAAGCEPGINILFHQTAKELRQAGGCTAGEAWQQALAALFLVSALKNTDIAVLKRLGVSLGLSDRLDQEKHLKLAREQLRQEIKNAEELALKNGRLYRYLGVLGGLALVLILY